MVRRALIVALLAAAIPVAQPAICSAADNSATLIVEAAPGATRSICVGFDGADATVLDLLERSGLPITYQDFGGGNVMMCRIGGVGCDYPREGCTCAFEGKREFWGMYLREQDRWTFAQTGAASTVVRAGAVVGWRWGAHDGENDPPTLPEGKACEDARTVSVPGRSSRAPLIALALIAGLAAVAFVVTKQRKGSEVPS